MLLCFVLIFSRYPNIVHLNNIFCVFFFLFSLVFLLFVCAHIRIVDTIRHSILFHISPHYRSFSVIRNQIRTTLKQQQQIKIVYVFVYIFRLALCTHHFFNQPNHHPHSVRDCAPVQSMSACVRNVFFSCFGQFTENLNKKVIARNDEIRDNQIKCDTFTSIQKKMYLCE